MGITQRITSGNGANVNRFDITSNYTGDTLDFSGIFGEMCIYESAFDTTCRVTCDFFDSGHTDFNTAVTEGEYHITATEKVELNVNDTYENELDFTEDYHLRVRAHTRESQVGQSNNYSTFSADFYSWESIENNFVDKRPTQKFDGQPSDHIQTLLGKDWLNTPKPVEVDPTIIPYNFLGYSDKVFYHCVNLCNKGVYEKENILAGYLFFERAKGTGCPGGYYYKSIDKLFQQPAKKKYIYNNTELLPNGYDGKIINFKETRSVNAERDIDTASTLINELKTFDPRLKCFFKKEFNGTDQEIYNAGIEYYKFTPDIDWTRAIEYNTKLYDIGTIPHGTNWDNQVNYANDIDGDGNYIIDNLISQASARLNQLLGTQIHAQIPMDLSLHVGELIEIDFPQIESSQISQDISNNRSGIYMIIDICHTINRSYNYTVLNLCRDSTTYKK